MEHEPQAEPTIAEILDSCEGLVSPEDVEGMEIDEVLGYTFTVLLENGEDPEEYLRTKGILI